MIATKKLQYQNVLKKSSGFKELNKPIFCSVIFLSLFGILMLYSASCYSAKLTYGDSFFFVKKQFVGFLLGLLAMLIVYKIDFNVLKKYSKLALLLSIILLALVFVPFLSVSNYGATRWIGIGSFTIQPSELAKFGLVLFSAGYLSKNYSNMHKFRTLLPVLCAGGLMCVLIMLEPNMSITICVGATLFFMLFVGGAKIKHLLLMCIPVLAIIPILLLEPYRLKRLTAFLDPWSNIQDEGFQLVQSLYSLGSGGTFGVGLFNSRQKYLFLPFSESDFIFSIIGEELGFVGCIAILLVFALLIFYGFKVAKNAPNRFGSLLASGITFVIAIQVVLNIAVVTGSVPPTGLPLPFMSAGSTALVCNLAMIGVLLNIDRQSRKNMIKQ